MGGLLILLAVAAAVLLAVAAVFAFLVWLLAREVRLYRATRRVYTDLPLRRSGDWRL